MKRSRTGVFWVVFLFLFISATAAAGVSAFRLGRGSSAGNESGMSDVSAPPVSSRAPAQSAPSAGGAAPVSKLHAVWITTLTNIDFPSKAALSVAAQEKEIDAILTKVSSLHFNAVFLQVRPNADALYPSAYYPWSQVLTGKAGKDPGYDPLKYFVAAAHKRHLTIEAWVNPYRVQRKADPAALAVSSPARLHPDWVFQSADGGLYFNPGVPQVRQLVEKGVTEIVRNYDVDGIVFDDYFYPDKTVNDAAAYQKYGGGAQLDDWRRGNVTSLIEETHAQIGQIRKGVALDVSPFAVWANSSSNPLGSDTAAGCQSYYDQYADTRLWVQKGYVDGICPQIYWKQGNAQADFDKLLSWWSGVVKGTGVKLYPGIAVYKMSSEGWQAADILAEVRCVESAAGCAGEALYGYSELKADSGGVAKQLSAFFK